MTQRACEGADTVSTRHGGEHMEECRDCKRRVRFDLVDHWFFGFTASCSKPSQSIVEGHKQPRPCPRFRSALLSSAGVYPDPCKVCGWSEESHRAAGGAPRERGGSRQS